MMWLSYDGKYYCVWHDEPRKNGNRFIGAPSGWHYMSVSALEFTKKNKQFNLPDMEPMTCVELESITFKAKQ